MEYNKAVSEYCKVINKLDEQIQDREIRLEAAKGKIKEIKEQRKAEIKEGLFSNAIKKFTKTKDLSEITTEIEVLTVELEALRELRAGDDKTLLQVTEQLIKAAKEESERLVNIRQAKIKEMNELEAKARAIRIEISNYSDGSLEVLGDTAMILSDVLKAKFPDKFERYFDKGLLHNLVLELAK